MKTKQLSLIIFTGLIMRMADPLSAFDEPEQTLKIRRDDGSSVEIKAERGRIWIRDSKKRGVASALDAEDFANALSCRYL